MARKDIHRYYMDIAEQVRTGARCRGRHVGTVVVKNNRIISTGYNGTPEGVTNCDDGGCPRCDPANKQSGAISAGGWYDICICVHAEENALITAARFGTSVEGATVYTTLQPCFICMRELLQAKIKDVYYQDDWTTPAPFPWVSEAYKVLANKIGLHKLTSPTPAAAGSGQPPAGATAGAALGRRSTNQAGAARSRRRVAAKR